MVGPSSSTLIYVNTKKDADEIAEWLQKFGVSAAAYHADRTLQQRQDVHSKFLADEIQVVAATVAFGMGIDKPDIRRILHYGLPRSVEAYVQQSGRAGRDGLPSEGILFYRPEDEGKTRFLVINDADAKQLTIHYPAYAKHLVDIFTAVCQYASSRGCRRQHLMKYFREEPVKEHPTALTFNPTLPDTDPAPLPGTARNYDDAVGVCREFIVDGIPIVYCGSCDNCKSRRVRGFVEVGGRRGSGNDSTRDGDQRIDMSRECRIIIKCVETCRGRSGMAMPCKVACGSKEKGLLSKNYDKSPQFGAGSHRSVQWWMDFIRHVRDEGYLKETLTSYGAPGQLNRSFMAISVTPKGQKFLADEGEVMLCELPEQLRADTSTPGAVKGAISAKANQAALDAKLYRQLLDLRIPIARRLQVAPFMIIQHGPLKQASECRPSSVSQLRKLVHDIPASVETTFLDEVVNTIRSFCNAHLLPMDIVSTPPSRTPIYRLSELLASQTLTDAGSSPADVMSSFCSDGDGSSDTHLDATAASAPMPLGERQPKTSTFVGRGCWGAEQDSEQAVDVQCMDLDDGIDMGSFNYQRKAGELTQGDNVGGQRPGNTGMRGRGVSKGTRMTSMRNSQCADCSSCPSAASLKRPRSGEGERGTQVEGDPWEDMGSLVNGHDRPANQVAGVADTDMDSFSYVGNGLCGYRTELLPPSNGGDGGRGEGRLRLGSRSVGKRRRMCGLSIASSNSNHQR
eukprot:GHVQ01020818.1.p1 GENE.GHVQ01020818.1~~GHVQ01020818.1.p1  ORF type:complete len:738 (+),score=86.56 GHVQ01020818.1:1661-3874(+)